jgi:hypothetical protein
MKTVCDGASSGFPAGFWSDQPSTAAQEVLDEMLASTSTRQLNPTVDT